MPLPNFLIIGSAKGGTTSLYYALQQHPEIFLPLNKEPKFLSFGEAERPMAGPGDREAHLYVVRSLDRYKRMFDRTTCRARGEASADTIYYSSQAVPRIQKILGRPRILCVLRDPVERAWSAYRMLVLGGRETLSFSKALEKEEERKKRGYEFIWHYKSAGLYAEDLERFLKSFETKVLFTPELSDAKTYREICDFLEVPPLALKVGRLNESASGLRMKAQISKKLFSSLSQFDFSGLLFKTRNLLCTQTRLRARERTYLEKFFKLDQEKLEAMLGRRVPWSKASISLPVSRAYSVVQST